MTTLENQTITAKAVGYYKKVDRTVTGITVKNIIEKNGKTFGVAKFADVAHAVVKVAEGRWQTQ